MKNWNIPQIVIVTLLLSAVITLFTIFGGAILNGSVFDAAENVGNIMATPNAPLTYPSEIILMCNHATGQTVEIIFNSRWEWETVLYSPEYNYSVGACP